MSSSSYFSAAANCWNAASASHHHHQDQFYMANSKYSVSYGDAHYGSQYHHHQIHHPANVNTTPSPPFSRYPAASTYPSFIKNGESSGASASSSPSGYEQESVANVYCGFGHHPNAYAQQTQAEPVTPPVTNAVPACTSVAQHPTALLGSLDTSTLANNPFDMHPSVRGFHDAQHHHHQTHYCIKNANGNYFPWMQAYAGKPLIE